MMHRLKSWPEFFQPIATGERKFDLRRFDRSFKVGDSIEFLEWQPDSDGGGDYTGHACRCLITSMLRGVGTGGIEPLKGLAGGYVILGLGKAYERQPDSEQLDLRD